MAKLLLAPGGSLRSNTGASGSGNIDLCLSGDGGTTISSATNNAHATVTFLPSLQQNFVSGISEPKPAGNYIVGLCVAADTELRGDWVSG